MLDQEFFPLTISKEDKVKRYKKYEITIPIMEKYLKGEMVRPTWNHRNVDTLYGSCSMTPMVGKICTPINLCLSVNVDESTIKELIVNMEMERNCCLSFQWTKRKCSS